MRGGRPRPFPAPPRELEASAAELICKSYAPATLLNYHRAWLDFKTFLSQAQLPDSFPHSEAIIELYITYLANSEVSLGLIKGALSAIAWHHKAGHQPDPTKSFGAKRMLAALTKEAPAPKKADPISLLALETCLDKLRELGLPSYDTKLVKAMLLLLYYGCLRVGEVALSSNPDTILRYGNSEFLTLNGVRHFKFTLVKYKHSKGPIALCLPPNPSSRHCPVSAIWEYFSVRPRGGEHCFVLANGSPVPRTFIAAQLAKLLGLGGFTAGHFGTHSLRAGRATDLAAAGVSDAEIRATGRWSSDAFKGYLRFPILPAARSL